MAGTYLHIIAFNIPLPADYGGVIDIHYKLKALRELGIQTILHCYTYGRQPSKELEELCLQVHYYPRAEGWKYLLSRTPYIVSTRNANSMPKRLLGDPFPVLFEGLHTTAMLDLCREAGKLTLVRAHNIEHRYYRSLARAERRLSRKLFLIQESMKLKRYETVLSRADHILAISKPEAGYFARLYGEVHFVPAFHRFDEVTVLPGSGEYILFHGNLGVAENERVLRDFILPRMSASPHRLVVAGKDPSSSLIRRLQRHPMITLVANPADGEMAELIRQAHINLLLSHQATGIKLKLLHGLFAGRHCLVNRPVVEGSGLESLCTVIDTPAEMQQQVDRLMALPIEEAALDARKKALKDYSNRAGAEKILRLIG